MPQNRTPSQYNLTYYKQCNTKSHIKNIKTEHFADDTGKTFKVKLLLLAWFKGHPARPKKTKQILLNIQEPMHCRRNKGNIVDTNIHLLVYLLAIT